MRCRPRPRRKPLPTRSPEASANAIVDGGDIVPTQWPKIRSDAWQASDISGTRTLLPALPPPADLVADKAYDVTAYRQRNLIERSFCRLRDWRTIAIRYDKTARNFLAGICLVLAVATWCR